MIEGLKPYSQSVDDFSQDDPRGFTRIRVHPRHPCNPCYPCSIASPRFDLCSSAVNIRARFKTLIIYRISVRIFTQGIFMKVFLAMLSGIFSTKSKQRAQSLPIPVAVYEKAAASRFRTRMTRIARIFTDTRASSSAQSVFSRIYSLINEDTNPQISQIRADLLTGGQT